MSTMVTQPGLHDKDLVLWTQLLAEVLNAEMLERLRAEHPRRPLLARLRLPAARRGAAAVGEVAENLGVTSQAISKVARELEALGYVERAPDPADARVRRLGAERARPRGGRGGPRRSAPRSTRELAEALGAERVEAAARTLMDALARPRRDAAVRGSPRAMGRRTQPLKTSASGR